MDALAQPADLDLEWGDSEWAGPAWTVPVEPVAAGPLAAAAAPVDPVVAVAERLAEAALGMVDVLSVHLGDRLGLYRALAGAAATPAQLAHATGSQPRYVLEWCRQQAVTGFLQSRPDGRYALAPGVAEVLLDEHHLRYSAPLARMLAGLAVQVPRLVEAYRTGGGLRWAEFGADVREARAAARRPWFESALVDAVNSEPRLAARFASAGRIADIGCRAAWSSIAMARGWPAAEVVGFEGDELSVVLARDNVHAAGLRGRVEIRRSGLADLAGTAAPGAVGGFDLVTAFDSVHETPHPVAVLRAAREALAPGGAVLVVEEAVGDVPGPVGDPAERMLHGLSLLGSLPDAMTAGGSAATGTVMRPATLATYAGEAGFSVVEPLPVQGCARLGFTLLLP
ncbi:class I SAM-dependent methyltransferase [Kineococcus sp. SYSU DK003]|uniref:class I SAM-dependent methyltransferase n=1 Tax=Kineococcus sp. SYSU DK003 TaxID=3383124 RepID=UPI003D7E3C73